VGERERWWGRICAPDDDQVGRSYCRTGGKPKGGINLGGVKKGQPISGSKRQRQKPLVYGEVAGKKECFSDERGTIEGALWEKWPANVDENQKRVSFSTFDGDQL